MSFHKPKSPGAPGTAPVLAIHSVVSEFEPRYEDELGLTVGLLVHVTQMPSDGGWWCGFIRHHRVGSGDGSTGGAA
eukprot:gene25941-4539_t